MQIDSLLVLLALASFGLLIYAYAGYPLLLWLLGRFLPARTTERDEDSRWPKVSIVLSAYNEDARVAQILEHGASGYLVKQDPASDVAMAIREVAAGNAYFSPCISQHFRAQCRQAIRGSEQPEGKSTYLTSREAEVLQLVAEGYANKQVADVLGIGFKTVQKHRQSLMDKLRIHETAGLTRYAVAQKVIEVPGRVPRWSERGYASNPAPASERALSASSANFGSPVGSVS